MLRQNVGMGLGAWHRVRHILLKLHVCLASLLKRRTEITVDEYKCHGVKPAFHQEQTDGNPGLSLATRSTGTAAGADGTRFPGLPPLPAQRFS